LFRVVQELAGSASPPSLARAGFIELRRVVICARRAAGEAGGQRAIDIMPRSLILGASAGGLDTSGEPYRVATIVGPRNWQPTLFARQKPESGNLHHPVPVHLFGAPALSPIQYSANLFEGVLSTRVRGELLIMAVTSTNKNVIRRPLQLEALTGVVNPGTFADRRFVEILTLSGISPVRTNPIDEVKPFVCYGSSVRLPGRRIAFFAVRRRIGGVCG